VTGPQQQQRNFLGIPVKGDLNFTERRTPQKPLEELAPLMQAVLDDPTIAWFGWKQYTPYFNDGEPCVFSVNAELAVSFTSGNGSDEDDEDDEDDAIYGGVNNNASLGKREYDFKSRSYGAYSGPDEARYNRCLALEQAINSGAFDDVLLEHFGDHATIRVSRDGIQVEFYEHD
jgi:hypothetical protein